MGVPQEIAKLVDGPVLAHAALGSGLNTPIGETHVVATHGGYAVFTRESLVGDFTRVDLDPALPPKLESGDFSDTLHLALADGSSAETNVSSFERDALRQVLTHPIDEPPPPPATAVAPSSPVETTPAMPVPTSPQSDDAEAEPGAAPEDDQADKDEAVYHGGETGFVGCLAQTLLFFGAIAAFWYLHDLALQGLYGPANPASREGFIYVITKGLALACGVYAGARLAGLVTYVRRSRNLGDRVEFKRRGVAVVGANGLWRVSIDTSRPFELAAIQEVKPRGNASGTNRDQYLYYVRIAQQGDAAVLCFVRYATEPLPGLAGLPLTPGPLEVREARTLRMSERTCLQVAARLKKMHEPFAKTASTGDNGAA